MTMGETIAKLRRDRSMTQENLAEALGVSPQTVSKWENSVNLPDVQMLPLLADVFGVQIDALFGRENADAKGTPDQAFARAEEAVRRVLAGVAQFDHRPFEQWWEEFNALLHKDSTIRSAVYRTDGVVYVRESAGALALKRPEAGWASALTHEGAGTAAALLADKTFCRALAAILTHKLRNFTLPHLAKLADAADLPALEQSLRGSGLFKVQEMVVGEENVTFFTLEYDAHERLLPLLAAMVYCAEFAEWRSAFCVLYGGEIFFE